MYVLILQPYQTRESDILENICIKHGWNSNFPLYMDCVVQSSCAHDKLTRVDLKSTAYLEVWSITYEADLKEPYIQPVWHKAIEEVQWILSLYIEGVFEKVGLANIPSF